MISFKDAAVGYGRKALLEGITFDAQNGYVTALLGKNGCGKSTLLRAVCGNLGYSGSISADGGEIRTRRREQLARQISLMPQLLPCPSVSVRELVGYGRQPYTGMSGILTKRDREIAEEAISSAGLSALAGRNVAELSGGERQRAFFAMLRAQDTPNLLLDEPCAHLDAENSRRIAEFILSEKKRGKTVITVLHDINMALSVADMLVVFDEGKTVFQGDKREFLSRSIAETVFGLQKLSCRTEEGEATVFRQRFD